MKSNPNEEAELVQDEINKMNFRIRRLYYSIIVLSIFILIYLNILDINEKIFALNKNTKIIQIETDYKANRIILLCKESESGEYSLVFSSDTGKTYQLVQTINDEDSIYAEIDWNKKDVLVQNRAKRKLGRYNIGESTLEYKEFDGYVSGTGKKYDK